MQNPVSASEEVQVAIGADTSQFQSAMGDASAATAGLKGKLGKLGTVLVAGGAAAGLGVAAAFGKAASSASDFQSSMTDVAKVTDQETAQALRDDLMALSEEIPVSRSELTKLAEQAGKYGVESESAIAEFVETAGKMSTAMDLPADELGKRMAKIAQATNTPISQIGKLGDATNALADNFKTDAGEVTETAQRAGIALSNRLGLGTDQVLSLSAAMNEVSPSARRASGSLKQMTSALTDPKRVQELSSALSMSPDAFKKMREERPQALMEKIATGLDGNTEKSEALSNALGKRGVESFGRFSEAIESADKAQQTVNKQFENGTSLQRELEMRTDTLQGKMQLLRDKVNNVATRIGEKLLPYVMDAVEGFGGFIDVAEELGGDIMPDVREQFEEGADLFSDFVDTNEEVDEAVGGVGDTFSSTGDAVRRAANGKWSGAFGSLEDAADSATDSVRAALVGDSGSGGLASAVGEGARDANDWLETEGSTIISEGFDSLTAGAVDGATDLQTILVGPNGKSGALTEMVDSGTDFLENTAPSLVGDATEAIGGGIRRGVIDMTNPLRGKDSKFWDILADSGTWLVNNVPDIMLGVGSALVNGLIEGVTGLYDGLVGNSALRTPIEDAATWLVNNAGNLMGSAGSALVSGLLSPLDVLAMGVDKSRSFAGTVKRGVDTGVSWLKNKGKSTVKTGAGALVDGAKAGFNVFEKGVSAGRSLASWMKRGVDTGVSWLKNKGKSTVKTGAGALVDGAKAGVSYLTGTGDGTLYGDVTGSVTDLSGWVTSTAKSKLKSAFESVTSAIKSAFEIEVDWPEPPEIVKKAYNGNLDIDWPEPPDNISVSDDWTSTDDALGGGNDDDDDGGWGGVSISDDWTSTDDALGGLDMFASGGLATTPGLGMLAEEGAEMVLDAPTTEKAQDSGVAVGDVEGDVQSALESTDRTDDLIREQQQTRRVISELADALDVDVTVEQEAGRYAYR
ncbi:phage tail tape measure protein [Halostella pelagica]|uniref:phage tail tape measure protein n=1 Tax=Halostella pelagica TaxID=2583824 RepID=UPI00107FE247|nr:phage tail tape measure protein [Halostella pelagica]